MDGISLLFESSPRRKDTAIAGFTAERLIWQRLLSHDTTLIDIDGFLDGKGLDVPKAPRKDTPALLRCRPMGRDSYEALSKELRRHGYRLITDPIDAYFAYCWSCRGLPTDRFLIESANPGASFGSDGYGSIPPSVYVAKDGDGSVDGMGGEDLVVGWVTSERSRQVAAELAERKGRRFTGSVRFERYALPAVHEGVPISWRVFYFEEEPFYQAPTELGGARAEGMPEPPAEVVDAFKGAMDSVFHSCDFILTDGGAWKCTRCFDGQMTKVPNGGDALAFCRGLSEAIERAPRTPDWVWCLTARVRDENRTGENRRAVHGTRHFRPGTKVYLHPPNWDERVAAIGVPRYSGKPTRVVMDVRKLERFSLEKVDDKEIVTALVHPYRAWPYTRLAPTSVGKGSWDASDESRERILEDVEWLSRLDPDGRRWS